MAEPSNRRLVLRTADGHEVVVTGNRLDGSRPRSLRVFDLGQGTLRPGLINAHDHLQLNHYPRLGDGPYANAYYWGRDIHARFGEDMARAARLSSRDAFLFGALKNLLGGVTTVVHHDPWDDVLDGPFPIQAVPVRIAHSLGFERDLSAAIQGNGRTAGRPLSMHVAEGTDPAAADEVRECERRGILTRNLLAVHLVGADDDGIRRLRRAGTAVVTCPTSNRFLLGRTPPAALYSGELDVLLGTDSLLTADGTMLDEIRDAMRSGLLDHRTIEGVVGATAARRLGLPLPNLDPGHPANVVLLRRPLGEATPRDVGLVLVHGTPQLGDEDFRELFVYCDVPVEPVRVGGVAKLAAAPLGTVAQRAIDLTPEVQRVLA